MFTVTDVPGIFCTFYIEHNIIQTLKQAINSLHCLTDK